MLLGDFGADVILVEPPGSATRGEQTNAWWELESDPSVSVYAALRRNKRSIVLDLKSAEGREIMEQLVETSDVLIEGFRPGAAARLGIDADTCMRRNPGLVYCSLTGYGQTGEAALKAGHDINYLADTGVLGILSGPGGRPVLPLNLIADFAGGGLMAAYAILAAVLHRNRTGDGQVIDLAMVDGVLSLLTHTASLQFARSADIEQERFFLSGLLPQYNVYECADARWVAVGALEPWFYSELMSLTGRPDLAGAHNEPARAPDVRSSLESWFGTRSSAEVLDACAGLDVCVSLVRTFAEAIELAERRGMVREAFGVPQVGIAPKLSVTPGGYFRAPPEPGRDNDDVRAELLARLVTEEL